MPYPDKNQNDPVTLRTDRTPWHRGLTYNSKDDDYAVTSPIVTTRPATTDNSTATSNTAVIDCKGTYTELMFFGVGTANYTLGSRVWLWSGISGAADQWAGQKIVELNLVLSSKAGTSGYPLINTDKIVDGITAESGYDDTKVVKIYSPGDDLSFAYVLIDTTGHEYLQVEFDLSVGGGTAGTEANFIYRQF